jgi:hypothetical protein
MESVCRLRHPQPDRASDAACGLESHSIVALTQF